MFFKETVEDIQVIQLSSGRQQVWFNMFVAACAERGSLQTHKYQLKRVGAGLDTNYELQAIKAEPVKEELLAKLVDLPPIRDLFKGTLGQAPLPEMMQAGTVAGEVEPFAMDLEAVDVEGEELV